jgi:cyanate permease
MRGMLKILLAHSALVLFANYLFSPIYAIFVAEVGGNVETAGFAYAILSISTAILLLLISRWEDHVRHRENLLMVSSAILFVGYISYMFVATVTQLFAVQIIMGIGIAIGLPAFDALYSENLDKGRYASEWGAFESVNYIVAALAASVGGVIVALAGFITLFSIMAVLAFLSFLMSLLLRVTHY